MESPGPRSSSTEVREAKSDATEGAGSRVVQEVHKFHSQTFRHAQMEGGWLWPRKKNAAISFHKELM